jgi:hypothetical protein
MNIVYPNIRLSSLPAMLGHALAGAGLAGFYGVVHDQVTYSICPEYFTRLKFSQFHYTDFGMPARVFVGEIGFLATWWVGFVAGWFLARVSVPAYTGDAAFRRSARGFLIMFAFTLAASITGYALGRMHGPDYSAWLSLASTLGIRDLPSFVRAAYIHNAGYLGGLIGLIAAIIYLRKLESTKPSPQ